MKQIALVAIGALALTWQAGRVTADTVPADAAKKLPDTKPASLTLPTVGAAPAAVKDAPPVQPPGSLTAAPPATAPAPAAAGSGTMSAIGTTCCDLCSSVCNACGNNGHFIGGVGLYIVQPYFENNPAFTVARISADETDTQVDRTDLRHHMDVAPELWLGYIGENGFGGRLRWWYFRQGTDQGLTIPAAAAGEEVSLESAAPLGFSAFTDNEGRAASISATSKLQVQVWDLEILQGQRVGSWDLLLSGGLRLAHINQNYNAFVTGDSGGSSHRPIAAALLSGHSFHGVGPVVALDARRPFADSGFACFGTLRGALLFGTAKQSATDIFTPGAGPSELAFAQDHRNRVLPVAEVELGLEYARTVGRARPFAQIALVGQEWWGGGNASRSTQTNDLGLPNGGSIIDNDFGFFGLALRLGVDY